MQRIAITLAAVLLLIGAAHAGPLAVELTPSAHNPVAPRMGDTLGFHTTIRNTGPAPVDGLIAWISLVRIDPGHEQPVDLEDWSAHKAVAQDRLTPGQRLASDWPMRLIQAGRYRVVVSVASRNGTELSASPFADFSVRPKPVIESERVLPVALGMPLLVTGFMLWRRRG